eukprot:c22907_g1_i1 orf=153-1334(+)
MAPASTWAIGLIAVLAAVVALDPFRLSPIADLPHFTAKPVRLSSLGDTNFPRDNDNKLQRSEIRYVNEIMGPESLSFDPQGRGPYTGVADGRIMRWDGPQKGFTEFATIYRKGSEYCKPQSPPAMNLTYEHICGRPLGLRFREDTGELYIADAYFGLLVVGPEGGEAKSVVSEAEGVPFNFTNDVAIDADGTVYFTDSSANYQRRRFLMAALSGDDSGRLLSYNPLTEETKVLYRGLQFPNGLAISKDASFLVLSETTTSRLLRFWIKGEKAGTLETFVNLPGFPDNVRVNEKGEFWVAIHCRRTYLVGALFAYPWARKLFLKLPIPHNYLYLIFLGGTPHAMALRYDAEGKLLEVLEDQTGKTVKLISEIEERDGQLWMGSVLMPYIAVYTK